MTETQKAQLEGNLAYAKNLKESIKSLEGLSELVIRDFIDTTQAFGSTIDWSHKLEQIIAKFGNVIVKSVYNHARGLPLREDAEEVIRIVSQCEHNVRMRNNET